MERIKILMINTVSIARNGITNVIFNTIHNIDRDRFAVDVAGINEPEQVFRDRLRQYGGSLYTLKRSSRHIKAYLRDLEALIKNNQYDIVHVHGNSHTMALELYAAKKAGCRVRIAHSHNTTCSARILNSLLTVPFDRWCTHGLACGEDAGKWLFGSREFVVIRNTIATEKYRFNKELRAEKRRELGIDDGMTLLCHVGRFNKQKNQTFLIDIFHGILEDCGYSYKLLFIGDGMKLDEMKDKAHKLKIEDSVIFLGGIDNVSDYLSACDIIVMPSLYEGLPLTLIEEQANGLPCIVSDAITKEADKTGLVSFLPISQGYEVWINEIRKTSVEQDRSRMSQEAIEKIIAAGYSTENEMKKIESLYLSYYRGAYHDN